MAWKVTVTPEVARLRSGDAGTRNVRVGDKLYTFNRNPTVLDELPDVVKNDPHLVVVEAEVGEKAAPPAAPEPIPELIEAGTEDIAEVEPAVSVKAATKPVARRGRPPKAGAKK